MWLKFMEPEDWVHVRVMTKVSNDIAMVVEKKVVIPDTPRKKKKNKMAMENHSF